MTKTLLATALLAAAGFAQAQSATYAIDPTHTFVNFEATHFGTSTLRGRFDRKEGTVQFDRAGKSGKAEITIDITSVSTGVGPLDGHLKSKDFFNAATRSALAVIPRSAFNWVGVPAIVPQVPACASAMCPITAANVREPSPGTRV